MGFHFLSFKKKMQFLIFSFFATIEKVFGRIHVSRNKTNKMSKLVQKTRWTQFSGALNEVCDLVLSRKVASAGAIKDCKSQMEWYNV